MYICVFIHKYITTSSWSATDDGFGKIFSAAEELLHADG